MYFLNTVMIVDHFVNLARACTGLGYSTLCVCLSVCLSVCSSVTTLADPMGTRRAELRYMYLQKALDMRNKST